MREKMPHSDYLKRRALQLHTEGLSPTAIVDALAREGLVTSRSGLVKFLRQVEQMGSLERCPGSDRPSKVTPKAMAISRGWDCVAGWWCMCVREYSDVSVTAWVLY